MTFLSLRTSLLAKVLFQVVQTGRLFDPVLDNNARATDNLAGLAFLVDLTHASPLAEQFVVVHFDQVDAVFGTKGLHQLDVRRFVTVGCEDTEKCFTPKKGTLIFDSSSSI